MARTKAGARTLAGARTIIGSARTIAGARTIIPLTDVTAPTYLSGEVGLVNATTVAILFSENITASNYATGVTIKKNTVTQTISSATRQSDNRLVYYVLSTAVEYGDAVTWEYTGGTITDIAANPLGTVTAQTVTNNLSAGSSPTFVSAEVGNQSPFSVVITFSEAITAWDAHDGMTVTVGGSPVTVDNGFVWSGLAYLTLHAAIVYGDVVTVAYASANGNILGSVASLASFTARSVTNNVAAVNHTYYVATDGNDGAAGAIGTPWLTIQHAANTAVAGDIVYIRGGTYTEQVKPANSGTAGHYITFKNYPSETVIDDGTTIDLGYREGLFHCTKNYIRVSGIKFTHAWGSVGTPPGINVMGIKYEGAHYGVVDNCITDDSMSCGIGLYSVDHIFLNTNEIDEACNGGGDEQLSADHAYYCDISGIDMHDGHNTSYGGEGLNIKNGSHDIEVHDCHVYSQAYKLGMGVDAWTEHTYNINLYRNIVNNSLWGIIIESEQGGLCENINVYNNIVYHNVQAGLATPTWGTQGLKKNVKFLNNTSFSNGYGYECLTANVESISLINNIFSNNTAQISLVSGSESAHTIDYNLFDTSDTTVGTHAQSGDPLFTNEATHDFHIGAGSPAIGMGAKTGVPKDDYDKVARGSAMDIGAYESVAEYLVFNIHMASDLSEFTRTVTGGGDISWTANGLAGTTGGMQGLLDDTADKYGEKDITPPASGILRGRFYFDVNSFPDTASQVIPFHLRTSGTPDHVLSVVCRNHPTAAYIFELYTYDDAGTGYNTAQAYSTSDSPHMIEFLYTRATTSSSSDGIAKMWIDGAYIGGKTDIDNYHIFALISSMRLGTITLNQVGGGTVYLDEFEVHNDNNVIGAV
jgi:hypothetical protein